MSWYSSSWAYRCPVAVDNTGGSASNIDWTIDLANYKDFDALWNGIANASAYDLILVDADGSTLLTFELSSYSSANRTGLLEVDNYAAPAEGVVNCWLYWGNAAQTTTLGTTVVPQSAKTGYIEQAKPNDRFIICSQERPGATTPSKEISKTVDEVIDIWLDVTNLLQHRAEESKGSAMYEEVDYVSYGIEASGSEVSAMMEETSTRFVETDGRCWVRVRAKAGTDATNYTLCVRIGTTRGRVIEQRALLKVNDPDET